MKYGLIGEHLSHSYSCEIHRKIGDYPYELREIPRDGLDAFMTERDFCAINVTIPYKKDVIPYLDEIDEAARAIGAVNTVVNREGRLYGYNTDFYGLSRLLAVGGISLSGKKVLILGTGGTSATALAVAKAEGAKAVFRVSRRKQEGILTYEEALSLHTDAQVIVNTTPVGMFPSPEALPIDISCFPQLSGVADAIYHPLRTALVQQAEAGGIPAVGGLYMLVAQAVYAAAHFFSTPPRLDQIDEIYAAMLAEKENAVLIGMPSSGKSTVGKATARLLGRRFLDSDAVLTERLGMPIPEYLNTYGEPAFRIEEARVIADLSAESGVVIATGGGAVLNHENMRRLKQNGKLFFLNRSLDKLLPTADRPLSSDKERLTALYAYRLPLYKREADVTLDGDKEIAALAEQIKQEI